MTSIFYYTARIDFRQCISRFSGDFPLFFARFGPENFPVAPNQHHSFGTCSGEPGNTGLSLLPVVCFHIHSKTACRGFESFCPCQKSQVSASAAPDFFVSVRNVLATRHGCAPRGACRGGLQPGGLRPGPTEAAAETSPSAPAKKTGGNTAFLPVFLHVLYGNEVRFGSDVGFSHLVVSVPNRCHPLQHPKRARLRLFSPEIGCVSLFLSSFDLQYFRVGFCVEFHKSI